MRPSRPLRPIRLARSVVAAPLLAALAGCAGLVGAPATGPDGLALRDLHLRELLTEGRYDIAYESVAEGRARPDDRLLRLQYEGLLAHHAGRWGRSNASLQAAADLAERRYTRSLTKSALSMVTNDRILAYRPPPPERLLVHYYGILNYLGMGDPEGAGVEARRLAHLLDLYADRGDLKGAGGRRLHAALRYVTGAAFEAIGEENDAAVAYRLARGLDEQGRLPVASVPGEASEDGSGEVLVIVERGFAPHRVERASTLFLWPGEIRTLRGGGAPATDRAEASAEELALELAGRALAGGSRRARTSSGPFDAADRPEDGEADGAERDDLRLPRPVRIAWPVYRAEGRRSHDEHGVIRLLAVGLAPGLERGAASPAAPPSAVPEAGSRRGGPSHPGLDARGPSGRVAGDPSVAEPVVAWLGDVTDALLEEGRREEPRIVARAIVRAAAKLAIARGIEDELQEEDEALGEIAGSLLGAAGALTERADTRSWNLLPARIGFTRLRLPAGRHRLTLDAAAGEGAASIELGEVSVRAGRLVVVKVRDRL